MATSVAGCSSACRIRAASASPEKSASAIRSAAPALSSARALAVWWSPAACGNGTSSAGLPAAQISAIVEAPDRHATSEAEARRSGTSWRNAATSTGRRTDSAALRVSSSQVGPHWTTMRTRARSVSSRARIPAASSAALLSRRAPCEPPRTRSVKVPPSADQSAAYGATAKNAGRTGLPVTRYFEPARADSALPCASATRSATLQSTRFVKPGMAFCSCTTMGMRRSAAATMVGPDTKPPVPMTTSGRRRTRNDAARATAPGSWASVLRRRPMPCPASRPTVRASKAKPSRSTATDSKLSGRPTNESAACAQRSFSSRAMASAG